MLAVLLQVMRNRRIMAVGGFAFSNQDDVRSKRRLCLSRLP
jgi:hypothetical protein